VNGTQIRSYRKLTGGTLGGSLIPGTSIYQTEDQRLSKSHIKLYRVRRKRSLLMF